MKKLLVTIAMVALMLSPTMSFAKGGGGGSHVSSSFHSASHSSASTTKTATLSAKPSFNKAASNVPTHKTATPAQIKEAQQQPSLKQTESPHWWESAPSKPSAPVIIQQHDSVWSHPLTWWLMFHHSDPQVVNKCFDKDNKEIVCPAPVKK